MVVLSIDLSWIRLRYLTVFLIFITFLSGDVIKRKTIGCPSVLLLKKAPVLTQDNALELSMYTIANDCVIVSPRDKVEAVGYDPLNSTTIFQKILYKKTDKLLYIPRSTIFVEQDGKKGRMRF